MEEPSSKNYTRFGFLILFVVALVILSSKLFSGPFQNLTSSFSFVFRSESLSNIVQNNLSGKEGDYAIYIESLKTGEKYTLRSGDSFPAASLYKLFLMAAVLKEVEEGRLKMDSEVSASTAHLISVLGSTDYGYEGAPSSIAYTVEEALTRVGRISDNFAAIMLAEKIGWDKVMELADSIGATNTNVQDPITTSASDVALFFEKLYKQSLPSSGDEGRKEDGVMTKYMADKIIEFLSLNQLNNRIPAKLPEGVKTIHKTGELARIRHDGGIVYISDASSAYVIVMMSQNLGDENVGIETMAQISKEVYDYFQAKK